MRLGTPTPNSLTKKCEILMKNWEKLPKNGQNGQKMAKNGQKWPKMVKKCLPQYPGFQVIYILCANQLCPNCTPLYLIVPNCTKFLPIAPNFCVIDASLLCACCEMWSPNLQSGPEVNLMVFWEMEGRREAAGP